MAARVQAEGWRSYEVEADHLAMLTAPKERADVLLPMRKRLPSSHPDRSVDAVHLSLDRMKHPLAQQWKASPTISLSFDQFEFGHVTFDHTVIDPPGEAISHRIFVGSCPLWGQTVCLLRTPL